MWRWLTALLLFLCTTVPRLAAQQEPITRQRAADQGQEEQQKETSSGNDALPYTVAVLSTAIVMIVIIKPSKKA